LEIARQEAIRLSNFFGVSWPSGISVYVTDRETAKEIQGVEGAAYRQATIIGFNEMHISEYARTVTHELAHILSHEIGRYDCMFNGEGFACFATWALDPKAVACGLPLHYHLVWMLSVGLDVSIESLWERDDYNAELYDLGWSFTAFCVEVLGRDRFLQYYADRTGGPRERIERAFGKPLRRVEKEWHARARDRVPFPPRQIPQMGRYNGHMCSRAAWLREHSRPGNSTIKC
jgi:hypothetical protein